jgi:hypothetical protein
MTDFDQNQISFISNELNRQINRVNDSNRRQMLSTAARTAERVTIMTDILNLLENQSE